MKGVLFLCTGDACRSTDYRRAIVWGSVWTGVGGALGALFAGAMLATFGNLVTAALVTTGAVHGFPMSTTHVASGGIFGAGAQRGTLDRRSLRNIVLAWIVTLPAAAVLGAICYALATGLGG